MFHKWAGHTIGGIQIHVNDRRGFKPFLTGMALVALYRRLGGTSFEWKQPPYEYEYRLLPFDILCGTDRPRMLLESDRDLAEVEREWQCDLETFRTVRENYLLY